MSNSVVIFCLCYSATPVLYAERLWNESRRVVLSTIIDILKTSSKITLNLNNEQTKKYNWNKQ